MTLRVDGALRVGEMVVEVEIEIERGRTVALVGPNGAGKSSIVRAIAGLHALESGRIEVDGAIWDAPADDVFVPAEHRRVGVVFQDYRLFGHLSARENVAFGLRATGTSRRGARWTADRTLERFAVGEVGDRKPDALSGGQAQRVALARAVAIEPAVLLLDEPMAALDVSARGAVRRDLAAWISDIDGYRLLVTHDPVDAHALADRVIVLEHGRVTQAGTMAELAAAPRSDYVADLMGTNLVRGRLDGDHLEVDGGGAMFVGAHHVGDGPVIATIRPAAVALHRERPEGSPRNVWETIVAGVDTSDGRVRVRLDAPYPLVVEVTGAGFASLDAEPGGAVWASVKASEITLVADA
jgi:molybdate transport system ATP-binding protein